MASGLIAMRELEAFIFDQVESLDWPLTGVVRLGLAMLCGGLVGLEREVRGRQAGFRTNLLVCLGSALVMVVSIRTAAYDWPHSPNFQVSVDPARIAYGVMTGVGFLGAGAIIQHKGSIRGLTTGAGLWCVAAIGLAAGLGLYLLTVVASAMVVAALWALDYFEKMLPRMHYRLVVIRRPWTAGCVLETVEQLKEAGYAVVDWAFKRTDDLRDVDIELWVAFRSRRHFDRLEQDLPGHVPHELVSVREA